MHKEQNDIRSQTPRTSTVVLVGVCSTVQPIFSNNQQKRASPCMLSEPTFCTVTLPPCRTMGTSCTVQHDSGGMTCPMPSEQHRLISSQKPQKFSDLDFDSLSTCNAVNKYVNRGVREKLRKSLFCQKKGHVSCRGTFSTKFYQKFEAKKIEKCWNCALERISGRCPPGVKNHPSTQGSGLPSAPHRHPLIELCPRGSGTQNMHHQP